MPILRQRGSEPNHNPSYQEPVPHNERLSISNIGTWTEVFNKSNSELENVLGNHRGHEKIQLAATEKAASKMFSIGEGTTEAAEEISRARNAERGAAEKYAAGKKKEFEQFKASVITIMVRATRPLILGSFAQTEHTELKIVSDTHFQARPKSRNPLLTHNTWEAFQCDQVFDVTASNLDVFRRLEPIADEFKDPQGHTFVFYGDGFSGSGKSFTSYTHESSVLLAFGKLLLESPHPRLRVVFEAFQTPGVEVESLDIPPQTIANLGLTKAETPPVDITSASRNLFRQKRPCYVVQDFTGFKWLVKRTAEFRRELPTANNATSSRTNLAVVLYVTLNEKTSVFCLIDMVGNERAGALKERDKSSLDSTEIVNSSRLTLRPILQAVVGGKEWVATSTAIGMWIKLLMSRPSAMLVMLFHVSTASSFDGAVRPTLVDMWNYKHIRTKHPNRTTAKST
ncbi:hypothetical protein AA0112_g7335 [Alternaria arborescens]|nr:hypothetical protein AA0111_g2758 [Alternaria arborescens]RYN29024.1 hypothetical protein AA0112_g7335 [Alternaria arborescens]RYO36079.1 hypothetical protein AA0111_g2758 [Alternaria arborescens]